MIETLFVIVRNLAEARQAPEAFPGRTLQLIATNSEVEAFCRAQYGTCVRLDEKSIKSDYRSINRFAYNTALKLAREEKDTARRFFLESHFFDIRTLLIRSFKCLLVLEKAAASLGIKEIGLFNDPSSLIALVATSQPVTEKKWVVTLAPALPTRPTRKSFEFKKIISSFLAPISNLEARRYFSGTRRKKLLIASGSLTHLTPVLEELRASMDILFWENQFNLEKYRYCRAHGLHFMILPERKKIHPFEKHPLSGGGKISFEGRDVSVLCDAVFARFGLIGFLNRDFDEQAVFAAFSKFRPDALLLDEDMAIRRTLCIAARDRSVPAFVIPHGVPIVWTFKEGDTPPHYVPSATLLVNSEFEKRANQRVCYDPARVVVTGTPRYDRIAEWKRTSKKIAGSGKTILYCGAIMQPYDFDGLSVLASLMGQRNLAQDFMQTYLTDTVWAIGAAPDVHMKIKPHYAEEAVWENILRPLENSRQHEVVSHRENILALTAEADIIITTPSSIICEALLFEKPVIVLDYETDGMSEPYEKLGAARVVKNREELKRAIQDYLFSPDSLEALAKQRQALGNDLTGFADGGNTRRAAQLIQKSLGL